jgi:hypothetical protein
MLPHQQDLPAGKQLPLLLHHLQLGSQTSRQQLLLLRSRQRRLPLLAAVMQALAAALVRCLARLAAVVATACLGAPASAHEALKLQHVESGPR